MDKEIIAGLVSDIVGDENVKIDEPMKKHTSFKLGGPADILITPNSSEQLSDIVRLCSTKKISYLVIGNGSNLIVTDKGIRGIVIKLFNKFDSFTVENDTIRAKAGMLLSKVSNIALKYGLTGLEFASGIPGTLGGAVAMNAGAYGGEMKDIVFKTEYLDTNANLKVIYGDEHNFGYRTSLIQQTGGIVLATELKLKRGDTEAIKALMMDYDARRKDKQPLEMPSAGSVFKRPSGYFAGKLIEDCGLRGYRIGGAEVSNKHCGFIVNAENATTVDVINLIKYIQESVEAKFGVRLETEVRVVGEE